MANRPVVSWMFAPAIIASFVAGGCSGDSGAIHGAVLGADGATDTDGSASASDDASLPTDDSSAPAFDASMSSADAGSPGPTNGTQDSGGGGVAPAGWTLTWSDEFNGPDGSAVDSTKWKQQIDGRGSGNGELQYYTAGTENAVIQGGNLVITATTQGASKYSCFYGTCKYTSARFSTETIFSQQYGRFEARAQMPTGKGLWPAIWLLGDNISSVGWPTCGEIDFMETVGDDISTNHGTLHMPRANPGGKYSLPNNASFADAFHIFAAEWEPGTVRFYVDDQLYATETRAAASGGTWEFEHPFFLLINVAVGGSWPGAPNSTTKFPQTLKVDWVRAYQKNGTEP